MNDDRDNSNIQSSSEGSPEEVNPAPREKDILALEQSIESDKEDPTNKNSSVKHWLLLPILLITLVAGFYFYTYKKDSRFFTTLPDSLMNFFSTTPQPKNLPDIQSRDTLVGAPEKVIERIQEATSPETLSKETPARFSKEIAEQNKGTNVFDKTTNENKKTIDLLRNEILSLKAELKQKSSPTQNFQIKRPHISGGFLKEKSTKTTQQEKKKPTSTVTNLPAKGKPLEQQSHLQKIIPKKRSEEVQAYLDFVENTGGKIIEMIEKGWTRLQALVMKYRQK